MLRFDGCREYLCDVQSLASSSGTLAVVNSDKVGFNFLWVNGRPRCKSAKAVVHAKLPNNWKVGDIADWSRGPTAHKHE